MNKPTRLLLGTFVSVFAVAACSVESGERDGVSEVLEGVRGDQIGNAEGIPTVSVPMADGQGCCITHCCVYTGGRWRCNGAEVDPGETYLVSIDPQAQDGDQACQVQNGCIDTNCDGLPDVPGCTPGSPPPPRSRYYTQIY